LLLFQLARAEEGTKTADSPLAKEVPQQADDGSAVPERFEFIVEYRALLARGEFDEAEKQLKAALEASPDSARLKFLHLSTYGALRSAGRNKDALPHLQAFTEQQMKLAAKNERITESFERYLTNLVVFASTVEGPARATEIVQELAEQAQQLDGSTERIQSALDAQRVILLVNGGRVDEARALVDSQLAAAEEALTSAPNDANAILRKATALRSRVVLEARTNGDRHTAASELLEFLFAKATAHPDLTAVRQRFEADALTRASILSFTDPDAAEVLLARVESLGEPPESEELQPPSGQPFRPRPTVNLRDVVRKRIEGARRMLALVGSPANYPENIDGWVNGEPLTPDALKGKVVLLDFFAVWCQPCIAAFPHLREWHDQYAGKGLEIIGISNYHNYDWDDDNARAIRQEELAPEAERAAMDQFAKHYQLPYPIAYVTGRDLPEFYGVTAIPHYVVIDRNGKVRLCRVGAGPQDTADVAQAIEECLAEAASSE
jgi:thiol-disulfide isomerase/thioredoxin